MIRARKLGRYGASTVVLALAASATACGTPGSTSSSSGSASGPIKIAVIDAQSGQASSLGQWEYDGVKLAVKQANAANLARIDGLRIYAGNDDLLADVLDLGEPGGILVATHLFGEEMRRMVDEPERRHEIDQGLQDVYRDLGVAPLACSTKAALNMIGIEVGAPRLPYVELDERETATVRAMLERHGLLQAVRA